MALDPVAFLAAAAVLLAILAHLPDGDRPVAGAGRRAALR